MSDKLIFPCPDNQKYRAYGWSYWRYKIRHDCNMDSTAKYTNGTGILSEQLWKTLPVELQACFEKQRIFHCGHDFGCIKDTPIKAIAEGEVVFSEEVSGFGSYDKKGGVIIIKHKYKDIHFLALYGHIIRKYKKGDFVNQSDIIGTLIEYSTNSFRADHLHFCIIIGDAIPPFPWGYRENLIGFEPPIKFIEDRR